MEEFELARGNPLPQALQREVLDVRKPLLFGQGFEGVEGRGFRFRHGELAGFAADVAAQEVLDAEDRGLGEPDVEMALGAVVGEGADASGDFREDGLDDVFGVGVAQAVARRQGEEVGGVLGVEALPGGTVRGVADAFEDAGMRGAGVVRVNRHVARVRRAERGWQGEFWGKAVGGRRRKGEVRSPAGGAGVPPASTSTIRPQGAPESEL